MANGALWHVLAVGFPGDFAALDTPIFLPVAGQESGTESAARAAARGGAMGAFVAIADLQWSRLALADGFAIAHHLLGAAGV